MRRFAISARRLIGAAIVLAALAVGILVVHDVSKAPTEGDRAAGREIMQRAGYGREWLAGLNLGRFEDQIKAVIAVQDAVLKASPDGSSIPLGDHREPADLLRLKRGYCYDRSRVIEKILIGYGLEVRHLAVYSTVESGSGLLAILTPQVSSHAVSEVKTARGWMMIDSNERFVALTADNQPVSIRQLYRGAGRSKRWSARNADGINIIFRQDFTYLVGLYSRHGKFYPPFTPVPDLNLRDFVLGNLLNT